MDVITRIIANCCWLNMHIVPPHGAVFEIRVADGYGARWCKDGSKVFILLYVFEFLNKDGIYMTNVCLKMGRVCQNGLNTSFVRISSYYIGTNEQYTRPKSSLNYNYQICLYQRKLCLYKDSI